MPKAARVTDAHICPRVDPGPKPHVGGPVLGPGVPSVIVGGMPQAVVGDKCFCIGPPDKITKGSKSVIIDGKPAARMGDGTAHGGKITSGCGSVVIG